MVFSSYVFIFAFLPVVLSVYYALSRLKNGIYQRLFLIAASLFFYGYYNTKYLILITASIAVNYGIALAIQTHRAKAGRLFLVVGILFNVGLIGYFKYYDFFVENINAVFGCSFTLRRLLLPLGISFFTFQQLSFLISVWRGEEKVERFRDYCIFVTFFPQLVAGPIVLYSEMIPQFRDERRRFFHPDRFASGIWLFTVGLFKKAVIADTLALFADNGFGMTGLGLAAGWITAISYTLQIYFDFSGYSDMAVGLGRMFNVDIPFNFRSPYRSESISEFWRRWHITLGRALSTYVYKPLGGNRRGLARTGPRGAQEELRLLEAGGDEGGRALPALPEGDGGCAEVGIQLDDLDRAVLHPAD
jgi:alginate O-acetyltransferase complex protein AlgI